MDATIATLSPEALKIKRANPRYLEISKAYYTQKPNSVIRVNYMKILTTAFDDLKRALVGTDNGKIYNTLQILNDAVNVWLEFNDYIPVPCFCPTTTTQNIFIKPRLAAAAAAIGGRKKSVRKGKKTTTKRKLRKGKSKKSRKNVRRYKKFSNKYKY